MNLIIHNLRVALRNLMKYKLQTLISVVSIAIGIVTLSLTNSVLSVFRPTTFDKTYYDRIYCLRFIKEGDPYGDVLKDERLLSALKDNGGLKSAERIALHNLGSLPIEAEFHMTDSTIKRGTVGGTVIDPEYIELLGLRSAVTGGKLKVPGSGEGVLSEDYARKKFGDINPVGAIQVATNEYQPIPITIVDVYKPVSAITRLWGNDICYYVLGDDVAIESGNRFYAVFYPIYVVLKEGFSQSDLLKEIEERTASLGYKIDLERYSDKDEIRKTWLVHTLIYLIGALILMAALIGFFRMEIQLFRLREREISLRMVNGARRGDLFALLYTEVIISIFLATGLAVVLGGALERFLNARLNYAIDIENFHITSLWVLSVVTGGILLILSSLVIWITLQKISYSRKGLNNYIRRGRHHLFRDIMLWLQITICVIFVCATFIIVKWSDKVLMSYNLPANDEVLRNSLYLSTDPAVDMGNLLEEIKHIPELDKIVMIDVSFTALKEIYENPEADEKLQRMNFFRHCYSNDPSLLPLLGVEVEWINEDVDKSECIVMQRSLYNRLRDLDLLGNHAFTVSDYASEQYVTLPIAGLTDDVPYYNMGDALYVFSSIFDDKTREHILVPKAGKEKELAQSVEQTIQRVEPGIITKLATNFRDSMSIVPGLTEAIRSGSHILAIVSLIVCGMGVFSAIALDTRGRRKEIAIRKVNGAKSGDIYRMFEKTYLILLIASILVAVPACSIFNRFVNDFLMDETIGESLSPVWPIVLGCLVVMVMIAVIVGLQIRKVMQTDPARIIAKE